MTSITFLARHNLEKKRCRFCSFSSWRSCENGEIKLYYFIALLLFQWISEWWVVRKEESERCELTFETINIRWKQQSRPTPPGLWNQLSSAEVGSTLKQATRLQSCRSNLCVCVCDIFWELYYRADSLLESLFCLHCTMKYQQKWSTGMSSWFTTKFWGNSETKIRLSVCLPDPFLSNRKVYYTYSSYSLLPGHTKSITQ